MIEDRIAFGAAAGPLRVQSRLGIKILLLRRGETLLDPSLGAGTVGQRSVDFRLIGRARSAGLVDEIDSESGAEKIGRPAFSAIGRAQIGRASCRERVLVTV